MTYQDAFKIGSKIEGYVKCTYAILHNAKYGHDFSLQRRNVTQSAGHTQAQQALGAPEETIYTIDVPVVKATENAGDKKFVPVVLTSYARDVIYQKTKSKKAYDEYDGSTRQYYRDELIKGTLQFEVMSSAIDWFPTDITNVMITDENGNEILLSDALAAAKKKLDEAKAILATAGLATVII